MNKQEKIIFIHIPKTGGSTLQGIINRQYGRKHVYNTRNNRKAYEFENLPIEQKQNIHVLKGHMTFGHHVSFPDPCEVSYFTMLRDPVKRIISNYYFILKQKNHHTHKALVENNYSLKDYVSSGVIANAENAQVRLLSNSIDTPHGKCTPEMLDAAISNLDKYFSVVGLTEYFDETVLFLKDSYNWRTPYYVRANETRHGVKKEDLDSETLDAIIQYNGLDIELYNCAKKKFEQRLKDSGLEFANRVKKFQKRNHLIQKIADLKNKIVSGFD